MGKIRGEVYSLRISLVNVGVGVVYPPRTVKWYALTPSRAENLMESALSYTQSALSYVAANFAWALVGALLGIYIPHFFRWWEYIRRPDILGKWKSAYQSIDEPAGTWVTEDVSITVKKGKFRLKNSNSSHAYTYRAFATLTEKLYLVGDWESIRSSPDGRGAFILTVSGQGQSMYGYWVGSDRAGSRRYGRWVLARNQSLLDETKDLLEKMRHPRV